MLLSSKLINKSWQGTRKHIYGNIADLGNRVCKDLGV